MSNAVEFLIPHLPGSALSPNGRVHWSQRAEAAREFRQLANFTAWNQLGDDSLQVPHWNRARITVEYRHGGFKRSDGYYRPRDEGNATAALKPLIDGIVDTGIIPDDSSRYLELGPTRIVKVDRYEDEGLYVTIEELQ